MCGSLGQYASARTWLMTRCVPACSLPASYRERHRPPKLANQTQPTVSIRSLSICYLCAREKRYCRSGEDIDRTCRIGPPPHARRRPQLPLESSSVANTTVCQIAHPDMSAAADNGGDAASEAPPKPIKVFTMLGRTAPFDG